MAQGAPKSVEIEQLQFKLHTKGNIFQPNDQLKSNINLLTTSSNYGLIFVGDPNKPQLKVVPLQGVINAKNLSDKILCREVPLPNIVNNIAVSCDGTLLAVNYSLQNTCFISIFSVPSFVSSNVLTKFANIPLVTEINVTVTQFLWNPVIPNTLAIILSNGGLLMYNLKETNYEFFSLDKSEQAKCACWSPKGKQIVVGFPSGKLMQYKPDLKPARTILCPNNIHDGPFDTIAVQWLSTYQFAAAFLQHGEDLTPCLYIINAPKAGNPVYINYYDICFSSSGPRIGQIFLIHIQSWNLLLVGSANSMEMGLLGTKENNETPTWFEYTMSDDSVRLALPMTIDKEETYPIGISFDTGITHQLMMNEHQLPVMPMVHLLSTHGQLISYDFLNLNSNAPGLCSPPQLVIGQSELVFFRPFELVVEKKQEQIKQQQQLQPDSSFMANFGAATSTPTMKAKPKPLFEDATVTSSVSPNILSFGTLNKPAVVGLGGSGLPPQTTVPSSSQFPTTEQSQTFNFFSGSSQQQQQPITTKPGFSQSLFSVQGSTNNTKANLFNLPTSTTVQSSIPTISKITETTTKSENSDKNKPLYTIPSTFKPTIENKTIPGLQKQNEEYDYEKNINFSDINTINVIHEMIAVEINSFQLEFNEMLKKSKNVDISIGNIDESKNCTKRLDDLKVISEQAQETFFETDVQILRHLVNECYSMIAEAKSKLEVFENPDVFKLSKISGCDQSNRRKLAKLNSYVATNHVQLKIIQQQIDSNWSAYQDLINQNTKIRMHIPSLEGIYQTLTKQKDILATQRKKISYIKAKLNIRDIINNKNLTNKNSLINIDSLADSILSMSLSEHVKQENSRLSQEKLQSIRDILKGRKIILVKPNRPDRMKSEVILECKLKAERKRDGAVTKAEKMMLQSRIDNSSQQDAIKPAATKPIATKPIYNEKVKIDQHNQHPKTVLNFTTQIGVEGKLDTDINKSQPSTSFSNTDTNNLFVSGTKANINLGSNLFGGNMFNSKPCQGTLFSGNQFNSNPTEKSAFAIPTTFCGFTACADSKNVDSNAPGSMFNFSVKTSTAEKQQQKILNKNDNNIFTPLSGSNIAPAFSGFNLGSNTTSKDTKTFNSGINPPFTNLVTSTKTTTTSCETKDVTDEFLTNLNICKPTATSAKIPDNLFSANPTQKTLPKNQFADFSPTPQSANDNMKPVFPGFGSITPTSENVKTALTEITSAETKTTNDVTKPIFSGFTTSTSSNTQPTNKISFSGFTTEALKTPFSGFGIPQSSNDVAKSTPFSGFGQVNTEQSKNVFSALSTTANTNSAENTKTSFAGFGVSAASIQTTKAPFAVFGTAVTTTATEPQKPLFSGFSTSFTASGGENKSAFSTLRTENPVITTEPSKENLVVLGTTATSSDNAIKTIGAPLNVTTLATTTATVTSTIASTTPTFGALNLTPSNVTIFGTPTDSLNTTVSIPPTSNSIVTTTQGSKSENQSSIFSAEAPTTNSGFGLFASGATPSIFGGTATAHEPNSASLGFSNLSVTTTSAPSIFAAAAATNTSPFTSLPVTSTNSIFGTSSPATAHNIFGGTSAGSSGGSIFGNIPKPDQSVFSNTSPSFGIQPNTNSGSIFGGSNTSNQPASPFGQQTSPFQPTAPTIFGGQKPTASNIFGTSNQNQQSTVGSVFNQQSTSPFGVSQDAAQTSIFGTAATESPGFAGGSIFGGTNQNINSPFGGTSQPSGFGVGSFLSTPSGSGGGAFSGFGNTQSGGGAFAQGGPSIAQTGFGSPNSSFSKPSGVFGDAPAFGSPPIFGGSPSFGGPPTFGGFGSPQAAGNTSPTAFSSPTQKNSLFESLGASGDNVSSFGNLAQNVNQNASKPNFPGGSSFSSWR